ncbi:DsbA family oxidoreductase [Streptomycetaceae bacterium NBC_01309]
MPEITVDIWSDLVCPWCYLGKRRFDVALAAYEHRDDVHVRWHAFELDPDAPRESALTIPQRMRQDLGLSAAEADRGVAHLTELAAESGLTYRLADARPVNSFDAHRLMLFAEDRGVGEPVRERLMRAYTAEGARLGDRDVLGALAAEAGLDGAEVGKLLSGDGYAEAVRIDENQGHRFGVTGVPTFVFTGGGAGGADRVERAFGARPVAEFADLLRRAHQRAPVR